MSWRITVSMMFCALLGAWTSETRAAWPVKFNDGTTIELVGVTESDPPDGAAAKWWSADGSPVADPQFQSGGMFSFKGPAGAKSLRLIIKSIPAQLKGKNLAMRVSPAFDQSLVKIADSRGELIQISAPAPADKPTFALRFGLASGKPTEIILWPSAADAPSPAATQPADGPFTFTSIADDNGATIVRLKSNQPAGVGAAPRRPIAAGGGSGGDGRFGPMRGAGPGGPMMLDLIFGDSALDQKVVVQAHGQTLRPVGFERSSDGSLNLRFRCTKDQVEKVVLSSRTYEWIEMQNVSTQPAAAPTQVKVIPVKDVPIRETAPSTGTPPPRG